MMEFKNFRTCQNYSEPALGNWGCSFNTRQGAIFCDYCDNYVRLPEDMISLEAKNLEAEVKAHGLRS